MKMDITIRNKQKVLYSPFASIFLLSLLLVFFTQCTLEIFLLYENSIKMQSTSRVTYVLFV